MKQGQRIILSLLIPLAIGCQKKTDHDSSLTGFLMLGSAGSQSMAPASGGTIQAATMSLTVPQGAREEETTITYETIDAPKGKYSNKPWQASKINTIIF